MIGLKLYRHTYHKDIYLARNWQYYGGSDTTPFYYATKNIMTAVIDANKDGFESWMNHFIGNDGKTRLVAKMTDSKEINIDGWCGTVTKEFAFQVKEFELVELTEGGND